MAFHLKPKEEKFFSLLDQHATLSYEAAELLSQAINGEVAKETALEKIDALADQADVLVMETMKRLQKTFITPMDREDIQQLIDQLDAAIDNISEIMDKMCMYQVGEATDGAKKMATITAKAMKEIRKSIGYMKDLKKRTATTYIMKKWRTCSRTARTPSKSSSGRKSSSLSKTSLMIVKI